MWCARGRLCAGGLLSEGTLNEFVPPSDLTFLGSGEPAGELVAERFRPAVTAVDPVGGGFYALVFRVSLDGPPGQVIVKCHKYRGRGVREARQLKLLRRHALVKVPRVYHLQLPWGRFPCEALIMETIPGVRASDVHFPDERAQDRFVDAAIANLKAWHAVTNPAGFGELEGPFHAAWLAFYGARIGRYHERIHQEPYGAAASAYVMDVVDRSFQVMGALLRGAGERPSLTHSDYNAWNMMVDPDTYELTGVIDPLDAGWAHPEIDLFQLANCRPELGMLERYLEGVPVDPGFWARHWFYRFWDDIKHHLRMGWYDEETFREVGVKLLTAMDEFLR
jgi:fructosamine-3-kinase